VANKIEQQQQPQRWTPKCRALYDYDAQDADELTFREGDIIEIDEESKTR